MTASVIVPAYNAAATLGLTLQALSVQDFGESYEVIVVDDGSVDNTAAVAEGFAGVRCARQKNAGPASARNHGARLAQGRFLLFTDSDCVPHPDWITRLVSGFEQPKVAAVCGSYGIANPQSLLARGIHQEILFRHHQLVPDYPKVLGSYNFAIRKDIFDGVGGFDVQYRQASGEDNALSYKVLSQGGRIYFERKALVDHYHTTRVIKYLMEQFRHGYWRVRMYADHPGMLGGDNYTFWKDMLEVPACWGLAVAALLAMVGAWSAVNIVIYSSLAFAMFEISFAHGTKILAHKYLGAPAKFFDGIFFGFVLFSRAFFRCFGLSTGIFHFLMQRRQKIFK